MLLVLQLMIIKVIIIKATLKAPAALAALPPPLSPPQRNTKSAANSTLRGLATDVTVGTLMICHRKRVGFGRRGIVEMERRVGFCIMQVERVVVGSL